MKHAITTAIAVLLLALNIGGAKAACDADKPGYALSAKEAEAVYDCLKADLVAGYRSGDKRWVPKDFVQDYRDWTLATKFPTAPGFHGGRFLMTYVNPTGAASYMSYDLEDVTVPVGTILANESFSIDEDGTVAKGPLYLMQKVKAGTSPKTDDWYFMVVAPDGRPLAPNVFIACSQCHNGNYGMQGGYGYPTPDARIHAK